MRTDGSRNRTLVLHAIFGPPKPVLVLTVLGTVKKESGPAVFDVVEHARSEAYSVQDREHIGCRRLSSAIVLDLRQANYFSSAVLKELSRRRDAAGARLRLVIRAGGAIAGQLAALRLDDSFDVYDDLPTAVLAP